ncbi:MAG: sugar transferase [Ignavibacteriae bacterium]|jgi:undecaprenyl-phosphate galactose phosphotransferase|nr:sugar transferase [Ignavibacteriota bacterium]MCE7854934.1 sugar transferase [Ignavibacteria bacterium CHB3]MEB2296221.1 sugar transferase [Ignavibacteria bacterium]
MKINIQSKSLFAVLDLLLVFTSLEVSMYLLRKDKGLNYLEFIGATTIESLVFFVISLIFLLIFQYNGLYRFNIFTTRAAHLSNFLKSLYYGSLNIVIVSLLFGSTSIIDSRHIIFLFILFIIPSFYLFRIELMRNLFIKLSKTSFKRNVLILGDGKAGKLLASQLLYENPIGLDIVGFIDDTKEIGSEIVNGKMVIGHFEHIKKIIEHINIDELIIGEDKRTYEELLDLIDNCKKFNVSLKVTSELFEVVGEKLATERYANIPVVDISSHYNNKLTNTSKRLMDIALSVFALIITAPLMILIATIVKLTSSGPILFKQKRIGHLGQEFEIFKFRSMRVIEGEDEERKVQMLKFLQDKTGSIKTKVVNDCRITWIGKIIRKTSLDELPQIFNVIKGDMSLVGPRPCLPYEYEHYPEWQKRRVSVLPGCTGVWQVWGRSSVSYKDSVVLDLYYINNMSPWFDLQLLFQTIPVMLTARGAK